MNDLQKLFVNELADIYDAEHQLIDALPEMAKVAGSSELKDAFERHLEQTKLHARRVEEVFGIIGETARRKTCQGMEGLIDEGQLISKEFEENKALDAGLICAAQKVEHYEIVAYGCLCTWADELGMDRAKELLKENLSEEKETDELLTQLAESSRNLVAMQSDTGVKGELASSFKKMVSHGT